MNVDLSKTMGFDLGRSKGVEVLRQTLSKTKPVQLPEVLSNDLTTMLNQSVNGLLANPNSQAAAMVMAQLVGYLEELARVTGALANGQRFNVTETSKGPVLMILPAGKNATV